MKTEKKVGYVAAVSDSISHANFILQIHDVIILCVFLRSVYTYPYLYTYYTYFSIRIIYIFIYIYMHTVQVFNIIVIIYALGTSPPRFRQRTMQYHDSV